MKTRLLSGLLSLLGFSGIAASCNSEEYQSAGEYGTPYARFTFKGTVTDAEAHSPLEGIRVISRSAEAPELTDTVYTDRAGAYLMEFEHIFPNVEKVELRADAQERENGILFEEARHTIIITEEGLHRSGGRQFMEPRHRHEERGFRSGAQKMKTTYR